MKYLAILLALNSLGTGLWAAYKWFKASGVEVDWGLPRISMGSGTIERRMSAKPPTLHQAIDAEIDEINEAGIVLQAALISSKLNKEAAIWTAASVTLSSIATFVGAFG